MINLNFFDVYFNVSIFAAFFLLAFSMCLARLSFNLGPLFIYRIIVTAPLILNIIFLGGFLFIVFFLGSDYNGYDSLISCISDKDITNLNIGEKATVNVTANGGTLSLPINNMNRVAAAISATGGATAGIQVAKYVGGPPAIKVLAGITTAGAVQLTTTFMSKVLDNNKVNKLVSTLAASSNNNIALNDYPLNLLFEINGLLICSLVFIYIIINIYVSRYLIEKDIIKYIPVWLKNNNLGKFMGFWLNKYLNLWVKSSNYFLGFCFVMLGFCLIVCKLGLFIILSS